MTTRPLGRGGPQVSAIGLGCMSMSDFYDAEGDRREDESIRTIQRALDIGCTFLDTADMYGVGHNEEIIGKAIRGRREKVTLATKFGIQRRPSGEFLGLCGKPEYVRQACEASLRRLGIETIDLYYLHRIDPATPIEETVTAMAALVDAGKVRHIGLSETSPQTLWRAAEIYPIAALQTEYSLWSRDPEDEILAACRDTGTAFVAYSPLGRGFLTGQIKSPEDLDPGDWRRTNPRFTGENFQRNLQLVERVERIAAEKGCRASQLALAWTLAMGEHIIPIPGTKRVSRLEENWSALEVELSADDLARIDEAAPKGAAAGTRYPEEHMPFLNG